MGGGMMGGMGGGMMGGMGGGMMGGMGGPMMGGPMGENYGAIDFFSGGFLGATNDYSDPYAYALDLYDDAPDVFIQEGSAIAYSDPTTNVMILSDTGNTITFNTTSFVSNGTLTGGAGADNITMNGSGVSGSINLGGGSDTLQLPNGGSSQLTISNVEYVNGGTGSDILLFTGTGATSINGSQGADSFTLPATAGAAYTFKYTALNTVGDIVNGFVSGTDKFVFNRSVFLGDGVDSNGVLDAALLEGANLMASNTAGRYWVRDTVTHDLYYDANAEVAGGSIKVADLDATVATGDIYFF
jgi:hypothetical protein